MSVKAMGRVWDLDIPHNKRLVLLAMADHADHEGRNIYPSVDLIAWKTGYSYRQVQRVIDTLIEDGILIVVKPSRQQHPATYSLNFTAGTVKPPFDRVARKQSRQNVTPQNGHTVISEGRQNVTPTQSRGDILTDPGVTFETPRVDIAVSPKPWEPIMNHDDDDDGRTLAFLESEAVGAAKEFAHLPYEAMRLDYQNRIAAGQSIPIIVKAWRRTPPTKDYHYEQQRSNGHDAPDRRTPAERPAVPARIKRSTWKPESSD
jgi:hypothetical protein